MDIRRTIEGIIGILHGNENDPRTNRNKKQIFGEPKDILGKPPAGEDLLPHQQPYNLIQKKRY